MQFKTFNSSVRSAPLKSLWTDLYRAALVPVPKRVARGGQKVCIIGEISKYVATMLRAKSLTTRYRGLSVLRSLKMLRVGGY